MDHHCRLCSGRCGVFRGLLVYLPGKTQNGASGRARGISDDSDEYYDRVAKEPHGTE